jgi:hypothetical protein
MQHTAMDRLAMSPVSKDQLSTPSGTIVPGDTQQSNPKETQTIHAELTSRHGLNPPWQILYKLMPAKANACSAPTGKLHRIHRAEHPSLRAGKGLTSPCLNPTHHSHLVSSVFLSHSWLSKSSRMDSRSSSSSSSS